MMFKSTEERIGYRKNMTMDTVSLCCLPFALGAEAGHQAPQGRIEVPGG